MIISCRNFLGLIFLDVHFSHCLHIRNKLKCFLVLVSNNNTLKDNWPFFCVYVYIRVCVIKGGAQYFVLQTNSVLKAKISRFNLRVLY